jgi:hypothetical protein
MVHCQTWAAQSAQHSLYQPLLCGYVVQYAEHCQPRWLLLSGVLHGDIVLVLQRRMMRRSWCVAAALPWQPARTAQTMAVLT